MTVVYDDIDQLPAKKPGTTRYVCMSDTHARTRFPFTIPDGDVFIHAGDMTSFGTTSKQYAPTIRWMGSLPHKVKIVCAGNHDHCMDLAFHGVEPERRKIMQLFQEHGITYVEHSALQLPEFLGGHRFFVSPYTTWHYGGAFMKRSLENKWHDMPEGIDILVTHGPAYDHLDQTRRGIKAGCPHLADRIRHVRPKVHVFGHIHEAHGHAVQDNVLFINAAHGQPIVFDL
ncbi:Metallo-dependent phosphatase [Hesseltinella vesiculosa]|uniref:Metallo-dependent phosphatase n=1 Tax=Hesseltinella vesiculosa TaxID=101127 RepID=A0A1X2G6M1_9FUNG|nr:Metallo-dependent phosphatase [Hesseltinella vesiculosa]